jgi:hypothetical protein
LQTGTSKDYLRVAMFLEQEAVDRRAVTPLLTRSGLTERFSSLVGSAGWEEGA